MEWLICNSSNTFTDWSIRYLYFVMDCLIFGNCIRRPMDKSFVILLIKLWIEPFITIYIMNFLICNFILEELWISYSISILIQLWIEQFVMYILLQISLNLWLCNMNFGTLYHETLMGVVVKKNGMQMSDGTRKIRWHSMKL